MRPGLFINVQPRVSYRADTLEWISRAQAQGGTVSATSAAAADAFFSTLAAGGDATLAADIINLNLFLGDSVASRVPQIRSVGSAIYSNTGLITANTWDAGANRIRFADYEETGPDGGWNSDAWSLRGTGFAGLTQTLNPGLNSANYGSNNMCVGGWIKDNANREACAVGGLQNGTPCWGWPRMGAVSTTSFTGYYGGFGAADYLTYTTNFAMGLAAFARTSASETRPATCTTKLFLRGVEVATATEKPDMVAYLGRLSQQLELLASQGSDYHGKPAPWIALGRFPSLPAGCVPIWTAWGWPATDTESVFDVELSA